MRRFETKVRSVCDYVQRYSCEYFVLCLRLRVWVKKNRLFQFITIIIRNEAWNCDPNTIILPLPKLFSVSAIFCIYHVHTEKKCATTQRNQKLMSLWILVQRLLSERPLFFIAEEDKVSCKFHCCYRKVRHENCLRWSVIRAQHDTRWSFLIQHPTCWSIFIFKALHVSQFLYRNPTFCIISISKSNTLKKFQEKCVTI